MLIPWRVFSAFMFEGKGIKEGNCELFLKGTHDVNQKYVF